MMKKYIGEIVQSTGKVEPKHWFHLVVGCDDDNQCFKTRDINCHNVNIIDYKDIEDGYKIVSTKESGLSNEEYLEWCIDDIKKIDLLLDVPLGAQACRTISKRIANGI